MAEKRIERQFKVHCHACDLTLVCPPEKDGWAWLKCGDVLDFFKAHDHGNPQLSGAEIEVIEKE